MFESSDSLEGNWLSKSSVSKQPIAGCATKRSNLKTGLIVCATLTDVVIVLGIATIEYYFRWTNWFPIRRRHVSLLCHNMSEMDRESETEFEDFWLRAEIPEIAIYIYSFSFPIIIILIGEVMVFIFANQSTKLLPGGPCSPLHIPHTIRRLYRFSLSFLFGIMCLMVVVDSIKILIGELRPNFYTTCRIQSCRNQSQGGATSSLFDDKLCQETTMLLIRKARTSCPSMRAAISMYAAIFTTAYLHGIGVIHHSKYLFVPLLDIVLVLISLLYGISLVVRKESWWSDIIIGHLLGASLALYLTFCVLRRFTFQETVSNRRLLRQLAMVHNSGRQKDSKEVPKIIDSCLEPVRLRRAPCSSYQCNCVIGPPLASVQCAASDDTSTFFPISKPNRKSVTLPISSPHIPMTHHDQSETASSTNHKPYNADHRLSAVNPSRRHIILSSNMPKISQELINLLNAKQEPNTSDREYISLNTGEKTETSIL